MKTYYYKTIEGNENNITLGYFDTAGLVYKTIADYQNQEVKNGDLYAKVVIDSFRYNRDVISDEGRRSNKFWDIMSEVSSVTLGKDKLIKKLTDARKVLSSLEDMEHSLCLGYLDENIYDIMRRAEKDYKDCAPTKFEEDIKKLSSHRGSFKELLDKNAETLKLVMDLEGDILKYRLALEEVEGK